MNQMPDGQEETVRSNRTYHIKEPVPPVKFVSYGKKGFSNGPRPCILFRVLLLTFFQQFQLFDATGDLSFDLLPIADQLL